MAYVKTIEFIFVTNWANLIFNESETVVSIFGSNTFRTWELELELLPVMRFSVTAQAFQCWRHY